MFQLDFNYFLTLPTHARIAWMYVAPKSKIKNRTPSINQKYRLKSSCQISLWLDSNEGALISLFSKSVAKPSTLGGGGGGGVVMFWSTFPRILTIFGNFDHLLSQTLTKFFRALPSILSKYQFHFDQLWANTSSMLTNLDQRLNYWGVLHPPHTPYSDVPAYTDWWWLSWIGLHLRV